MTPGETGTCRRLAQLDAAGLGPALAEDLQRVGWLAADTERALARELVRRARDAEGWRDTYLVEMRRRCEALEALEALLRAVEGMLPAVLGGRQTTRGLVLAPAEGEALRAAVAQARAVLAGSGGLKPSA
jgi:hypothetical protein